MSYPPSQTRRMSAVFHRNPRVLHRPSPIQRSRVSRETTDSPTSTFTRVRRPQRRDSVARGPVRRRAHPARAGGRAHAAGPAGRPDCGQPLARPEATRVIVVANQKGGVGKTTSTVNVAAALAQFGQRVLVVDLDPQGNASTALAVEHHRGTPSTYDLLVEGRPLAEVITTCPDVENLFVVPATIDLAGAEIELVSVVAREQRLHKALHADSRISTEPVETAGEDRFDFVFIDCPPSLGLLTINALVAGQEMLIPIQAEYYALEGLGQLLSTVDMVRAHLNPELAISAILVTMYDARTRLAAGVAEEVRDHFGDQVHQDLHPALGARLGGAVVQPDRDDLRSRLAGRDELSRRRARARGEGPAAPGRPGSVNAPRTQRRGLGRGLGSLIPTSAPAGRGARPTAAEPGCCASAVRSWRRSRARRSPSCRSTRSGRTRPSRGRSSTRRRWPSWCTRSARSGCCSPSWCAAPDADSYELVMGERRLAGLPAGRAEHHPRDRPRHRRHRHAAGRAAGEPAPRRS